MTDCSAEHTIELETASLKHLTKLRALWSASFNQLGYAVEDFESMFFSLDVVSLVALSSTNLCGFIMFEQRRRIVHILGLAVDASWFGQGIGTTLVERCMTIAKQDGCTALYFHTQVNNFPARKLFERIGFTVERIEGHYPMGEPAIRYSCTSPRPI